MEDRVVLTPKERLQRLSERLDISVRGLAALAEMSEATLYHVTDGTRDMSGRTAARLCYHIEKKCGLQVNRDWLMTGIGQMLSGLKPEKREAAEEVLPVAAEAEEDRDWRGRYYSLLERYSELQAKYTALVEKK